MGLWLRVESSGPGDWSWPAADSHGGWRRISDAGAEPEHLGVQCPPRWIGGNQLRFRTFRAATHMQVIVELTAGLQGRVSSVAPAHDAEHHEQEAYQSERKRKARRTDEIHRSTCSGWHGDAADTPHHREGGVAGDEHLAGEPLAEFDDGHGVYAIGDGAPDEDEWPHQRRLDKRREQQAAEHGR